jgi:hypothetical protein
MKEETEMKINKLLALLPVVAFAAACNGVAPAGPSAVASNDVNEMAAGGVSAMGRNCSALKAIRLQIDESDDTMLWVSAHYEFANPISSPVPQPCAPPSWRADHDGLTVDQANLFRAGFLRTETGKATVQASGPNGIHNTIEVSLSPTNSVARRPAVCADIAGVSLSLKTISSSTQVVVNAAYTYAGPFATPCAVAPVWFADRAGLRVNPKNPFEASIDASTVQTTVTATAPNGIVGNILF